MLVTLSKRDMAMCHQAAMGRQQMNRASGIVNQKKADRSDFDVELLGVKAELATAKVFGLEFMPFALGIDAGADLWFDDVSIDVKSTFHQNGRMLFRDIDAFKADCCVLARADDRPDRIDVAGWATRDDFKTYSETFDSGKSTGLILPNGRLRPLASLWEAVTFRRLKRGL